MKAEHINPFIEASNSVIKTLCGVDINVGRPSLKQSPVSINQVVIMVGIVGKIKGQVSFEMSVDTAKKIASAMMGGMPVDKLDEISKSAVAELGNMIMGNASTIFSSKNISVDITTPSLLTGDKIELSNKAPIILIPINLGNFGIVGINIMVED